MKAILLLALMLVSLSGCSLLEMHSYSVCSSTIAPDGTQFSQSYSIRQRDWIGPEDRMKALVSLTSRRVHGD